MVRKILVAALVLLVVAAGAAFLWRARTVARLPDRLEDLRVDGVALHARREEVPAGLEVAYDEAGEAVRLSGTRLTVEDRVLLEAGDRASQVWALFGDRGFRTEAPERGQYAIGLQGSPIRVLVGVRRDRVERIVAEEIDRLPGLDPLIDQSSRQPRTRAASSDAPNGFWMNGTVEDSTPWRNTWSSV